MQETIGRGSAFRNVDTTFESIISCTCSLSTTCMTIQSGVAVGGVAVMLPMRLNPPVPSSPPTKCVIEGDAPAVCMKHDRAPKVLRKQMAQKGQYIVANSLR